MPPGKGPDPWTADTPWPELVFLQLLKDRRSNVCKALEHEVNALGERGATWRVHRGLAGEVGIELTYVVLKMRNCDYWPLDNVLGLHRKSGLA